MTELWKYITDHAIRGECMCGQCYSIAQDGTLARVKEPEKHQPTGHTIDMVYFKVAINQQNPPTKEEFEKFVREHKGEFAEVDLFDGNEHNYIEIGAWVGDQGLALMLMGLGELLGCWKVLTPRELLGTGFDMKYVMKLAGLGLITIKSIPQRRKDETANRNA